MGHILICVICTVLFLLMNGASKAFGKGVGTIVAVGFPLLFIGGIAVAVLAFFAPFVMAVIIPLGLFAGGGFLLLKLLGLIKER